MLKHFPPRALTNVLKRRWPYTRILTGVLLTVVAAILLLHVVLLGKEQSTLVDASPTLTDALPPLTPAVQRQPTRAVTRSPPLRVVTYGSHAGYKFCWLLFSCAQEGLDLTVLGFNKAGQKGLGYKLLTTLDYLKTLEDDEVVLFVDAFDVIVSNNASVFLHNFQRLQSPLVFSAEKGCWPYLDGRKGGEGLCLYYYPDKPSTTIYRFVNTGSWMGYAWAARRLLGDIVQFHTRNQATEGAGGGERAAVGQLNDQELVTDFFVCDFLQTLYAQGGDAAVVDRVGRVFHDKTAKEAVGRIAGCELTGVPRYNISLDYEASLFQSLHNSEVDQTIWAQQTFDIHVEWDEQRQRWRNKQGWYPAVFHFNGGGKAHIDRGRSSFTLASLHKRPSQLSVSCSPSLARCVWRLSVWEKAIAGYSRPTEGDYNRFIHNFDTTTNRYSPFPVSATCSAEEAELARRKGWR